MAMDLIGGRGRGRGRSTRKRADLEKDGFGFDQRHPGPHNRHANDYLGTPMRIACVLLFSVVALAQSGLNAPRLGMMLDTAGNARPVFGISGSATLGDPEKSGILSLACSHHFCLFKTEAAIVTTEYAVEAPPGPALFAFAGDSALICFPLTRACARWTDGALEPVAIDVPGEILSLRVRANGNIQFAVRRTTGTWIVDTRDQAIDSLPTVTGPVILLEDAMIYTSSKEVILRRDNGSEIRFPLHAVESFSAMGEGIVQARTRRATYAIRITRGRERIFQLPEPSTGNTSP